MKIYSLFVANLKRFWRDPTALFFTIFFPLIFLLVFGTVFGGDGSAFNSKVAIFNESETEFASSFEQRAIDDVSFTVEEFVDYDEAEETLTRGRLDAIIILPKEFGEIGQSSLPSGDMRVQYLEGNADNTQSLLAVLGQVLNGINQDLDPYDPLFKVQPEPLSKASLTNLDYLVPGILGFAIMSLALFGMANGFTSDKKTGAIARLRAAPIKSYHVALSTGLVYMVLGVVSVLVQLTVAVVVYDFSMVGDWFSFLSFITLSIVSMFGLGLIIGGWAKNDKQAVPIAQLFGLPMMFLSGVFFPRFLMPEWLQSATSYLPLTAINDGLRLIATESYTIFGVGKELLIITVWGVIAYPLAFKLFRWE